MKLWAWPHPASSFHVGSQPQLLRVATGPSGPVSGVNDWPGPFDPYVSFSTHLRYLKTSIYQAPKHRGWKL